MSQEDHKKDPVFAGRRDFLKTASAASLGSTLAASSIPRSVHAAGDEILKVALIGCGGRGTGAAAQALATAGPVKLWAMADAFADRLETSLQSLTKGAKRRYDSDEHEGFASRVDVPPERRFVGLDAYRKAIDCGVEVVILTSPPGFRPKHFEYAVQAGKHAFMEKPVATDAVGVRRVIEAARQAKEKKLKIGVGLQRHHDHPYQETIRRLQDGMIGRLTLLRCFWNTAAPAKKPPLREGLTEMEYQLRNWYFLTWLSGDHIVEQHIHNIDVCNWSMNAQPVQAQGQGGRQVRNTKDYGNIFDHHFVEFQYADGTKMYSQCRQIPGCMNRVAEFAEGTLGTAEINRATIEVTGKEPWVLRPPRDENRRGWPSPYQVEHDVLFDAIRNDRPHNEAETGALSTMTAILGRMATYSGQVVTWDQAFASELCLTTEAESFDAQPPILPNDEGYYPVAMPGITKAL